MTSTVQANILATTCCLKVERRVFVQLPVTEARKKERKTKREREGRDKKAESEKKEIN